MEKPVGWQRGAGERGRIRPIDPTSARTNEVGSATAPSGNNLATSSGTPPESSSTLRRLVMEMPETAQTILESVGDLSRRHHLSALEDFLASCRRFAKERTLNVAVLGRFKAGKSSFLNHLVGRQLLPVGVVPVTTVITEIEFGPVEAGHVEFLDGHTEQISAEHISAFIAEAENPGNAKQVRRVSVLLPEMARYRGLRFVDTPGLDSVFAHNTDAALEWLPNVGLALVAVGVDPPLSQQDVELIRKLSRYTPRIALLLTKVDVLAAAERAQVIAFVRYQLGRHWDGTVPVFPYSIQPGFETLRVALDAQLLSKLGTDLEGQRTTVLRHKLDSLCQECTGYLTVALKAAETADAEREALRRKILGQKDVLEDTRLGLRLSVRHAAGNARSSFEEALRKDEASVRDRLISDLRREFPAWAQSLNVATARFDEWLGTSLTREMADLSAQHRAEFVAPVERVGRQLSQALQDFRNRLSERTLDALGVPLRTTEMDLQTEDPSSPDVRVGKIFDHTWELLSPLIPMRLLGGTVQRHFARKVADAVFMNLSRLASQWEAIVNGVLFALEKEALRRLDALIGTVEALLAATREQGPRIREDLHSLDLLRNALAPDDGGR